MPEKALTDADKAFIADETAGLIESSGQIGQRLVPDENAVRIFGTDDTAFVLDCEFPFEFVSTPVEILTSKKCDALISILPDQVMNESDRIAFEGVEYKVVTVEEMNVFGVISHKIVAVARVY